MNVESLIVSALNSDPSFIGLGLSAHMDVPRSRPVKFVTVERTGGAESKWVDNPQVAIQVWGDTRFNVSELVTSLKPILKKLAFTEHIHRVDVGSSYNFPDPESKQARYQIVLSLVTK